MLCSLTFASLIASASASFSAQLVSSIYVVDAHTVFEGKRIGFRFDRPEIQKRVSDQHRVSLLDTFLKDVAVHTVSALEKNRVALTIIKDGDAFLPFASPKAGRKLYIAWYPRKLMPGQATQLVTFTSMKPTFYFFLGTRQANLLQSLPGFVQTAQRLFPRRQGDISRPILKENQLVQLRFGLKGMPRDLPGYPWKLEWTVKLYILGSLIDDPAKITPSFISYTFPGSKLVPLRNGLKTVMPSVSSTLLLKEFKKWDELGLVSRCRIFSACNADPIQPFSACLAGESGILVAISPALVWTPFMITGYMLQLSSGAVKMRSKNLNIGIARPREPGNSSMQDLYDSVVDLVKNSTTPNFWPSMHVEEVKPFR